VARLRRKIGEDGNDPRFIRTVHGVGYAFKER
jgi:DNA-binding response OmpR family regulator